MRHRSSKKTLDRKKAPRVALLRTMAISLITYKKIVTTKAKAKVLRSHVDKLITVAKKDTLAARRDLLKKLDNEFAVKELIEVIAPKLKTREGGYVRIKNLERREGDGAEQSQLEIIQ